LGAFFAPELLVDDSLAQNDAKRHYAQSHFPIVGDLLPFQQVLFERPIDGLR
jgi:hypothetical protein